MNSKLASTQEVLFQRRLQQKDTEIATLQDRVSSLSQQLATALQSSTPSSGKRRHHPLSPHAINVREIRQSSTGSIRGSGRNAQQRPTIQAQREKIGRNASIATRNVLDSMMTAETESGPPPAIQRTLDMFQSPSRHMDYLNSEQFAKDLFKLAHKVRSILEREPRVVFLQSPCYVFGDIHGNLEDLHFFSDNLWRLGMSLTAGNFLFLGDYVDRGLSCLECVAYLFAMKIQLPTKVFLLRGNHETRDVNGWEEHYGDRSFIYQCRDRFGDEVGYRLWESCNQVFDRMPLSAVIDQDIFCVHGGIPRPVGNGNTTRIQDILTVPRVAGINPPYEHEDENYQQVASDCIWSDPASESQEMTSVDPETGFGQSLRGGGAICFGSKAVTNFLAQHEYSYIMRAHEAHAEGVAVSKGARVFTVFSTSKDHNQGDRAMAGCILVDNDKLQVINRSPAYRNQYVHRRDSISLASLSEQEIQKRIKLGLVTSLAQGDDEDDDEEGLERWEDFEDSDDEDDDNKETGQVGVGAGGSDKEEYIFDKGRRSSVDLSCMSENSHDDTDWETESAGSGAGSATTAGTGGHHHVGVVGVVGDHHFEPNKRQRYKKKPSVSAIQEGTAEEEDIETVNGDDEDIELQDANV